MRMKARAWHWLAFLVVLGTAIVAYAVCFRQEPEARRRYKQYLKEYDSLKESYLEEKRALGKEGFEDSVTLKKRASLEEGFRQAHRALRVRFGLTPEKGFDEDSDWGWGKGKAPGE